MDNQNAKKKYHDFVDKQLDEVSREVLSTEDHSPEAVSIRKWRVYDSIREYALREAIDAIPKRPEQDGTDSKAHFVAGFNQCRYETDENITNLI